MPDKSNTIREKAAGKDSSERKKNQAPPDDKSRFNPLAPPININGGS